MALILGVAGFADQMLDPNKVFLSFENFKAVDVSKATYVRLDLWGVSRADMLPYDYQPSGNAWMLSEIRNAAGGRVSGTFVLEGGDVVEVEWSDKPKGEAANAWSQGRTMAPPGVCGTWAPALLQADRNFVIRFLAEGTGRSSDPMRGQIMLFAWQLYERGDRDLAGRILNNLCRTGGGQDKVLAAAMNVLADAQYRTAYRGFLVDHDWSAYAGRIRDLKARYPQGWLSVRAMDELLDRIKSRSSGPLPVPSDANGLGEADLRLAARMTGIRMVRISSPYEIAPVLWLVPSSLPAAVSKEGDVDLEIRARGMAAMPLLLALFEDGALTEVDVEALCPRDYIGRSKIRLATPFTALSRPTTRGEVAQRILLEILPSEVTGGERKPKNGKDLHDAAKAFYDKYRTAADEDLAVLFLPRPYGYLNKTAIAFLLNIAKERRVPALEEFLVSDRRHPDDDGTQWATIAASQKGDLFTRYAALRGAEAQPVATRFSAWLRGFAETYTKPANVKYGSPEADQKHVDEVRAKILKVASDVEAICKDVTLDELLVRRRERRPGQALPNGLWEMLTTRIRAIPPSEAIGVVLCKAVETNDPKGRVAMARMLSYVLPEDRPGANLAPAFNRQGLDPALHADMWRTLVTDDREPGKDAWYRVSDEFLCVYERLFAARKRDEADKLIREYGAPAREFIRQRVLGRLSGTPEPQLPRYPQDAPLSAEGCVTLKEKLAAVTSREQAVERLGELSIYERVALPEVLRRGPDLNARLLGLANTIVSIVADEAEPAFQDKLKGGVGKAVTLDLISDLQAYCKVRCEAGQPAFCLIARKEDFGGCQITVRAGVGTEVSGKGTPPNVVTALACAPGVYGEGSWRLTPRASSLPPTPTLRTFRTSEPDEMRDFEQALTVVFGPKVQASCAALVRFQTKGGV